MEKYPLLIYHAHTARIDHCCPTRYFGEYSQNILHATISYSMKSCETSHELKPVRPSRLHRRMDMYALVRNYPIPSKL